MTDISDDEELATGVQRISFTPRTLAELDASEIANRIHEIGLMAHRSDEFSSVVRYINERILAEIDADFVGIALVERDQVVHGWGSLRGGGTVPRGQAQPIGTGVVGKVAATRRIWVIPDTSLCTHYVEIAPGMRSEVAVPLVVGNEVVGVLDAESYLPSAFGTTAVALLQALAHPVALAIQNARLFEEERRQRGRLVMLQRVSRILTSTVELPQLLHGVVETVRKELDYAMVAMGLVEGDAVVLRAFSADRELALGVGHVQRMGEGVTGEVVTSGEAMLVPDVRLCPNYVAVHPDYLCEMCCPLSVAGRVFGFIDAESTEPEGFGPEDLDVLRTVAEHVAQAVANAVHLQEMEALRRDLASMMAHDLRSPLLVVRTALDLLDRDAGDAPALDPTRKRYVRASRAACDQVAILVDGLLDLQRMKVGEFIINPSDVGIDYVVHSAVEQLSIIAETAGITLEQTGSASRMIASVDHEVIERVLQNLVLNAFKFTPSGGTVLIGAARADDAVVAARLPGVTCAVLVSVMDSGPGIPSSQRERVFGRSVMLDNERRRVVRSTGLGLAFCKQAVEAHGGAVWVDDGAVEGAAFHVLLPAVRQDEDPG